MKIDVRQLAVNGARLRLAELDTERAMLLSEFPQLATVATPERRRLQPKPGKISAAGRARISAAQKARWAKIHAARERKQGAKRG